MHDDVKRALLGQSVGNMGGRITVKLQAQRGKQNLRNKKSKAK